MVTAEKARGATYTPPILAEFVAEQIVRSIRIDNAANHIRILDPAVGEGELLSSLLRLLPPTNEVSVRGLDTNPNAVEFARTRLLAEYPHANLDCRVMSFLDLVLTQGATTSADCTPEYVAPDRFDIIIANPPYVRTQIMGAKHARALAGQFGLTGRVDLCHAFLLGMAAMLRPGGIAGIIVSNRFMTTRSGAGVRRALKERLNVRHVWDLGDTKLFDAAVLPSVILAEHRNGIPPSGGSAFTSIYETKLKADHESSSVIDALRQTGVVRIPDGRHFEVTHGVLSASSRSGIWRVGTERSDTWLQHVSEHTARTFGEIGKVRVGVKTCADRVFINTEWNEGIELLQPLLTHHVARRYRADYSNGQRSILYPHEIRNGRRETVDLAQYPGSREYLEDHRAILEKRTYVLEAGRNWYEIWVPQDPGQWVRPKLVFRDIAKRPCFWMDLDGAVVNGDCYWMTATDSSDEGMLWLAAAVGNSTFIEAFYDHRFNNKLYAGRRRFITQYVEQFPLPDSESESSRAIIALAKAAHETECDDERSSLGSQLDLLIWQAFGFDEPGTATDSISDSATVSHPDEEKPRSQSKLSLMWCLRD
jgi:adenine-specific DNA-methyltransferase